MVQLLPIYVALKSKIEFCPDISPTTCQLEILNQRDKEKKRNDCNLYNKQSIIREICISYVMIFYKEKIYQVL